MVKSLHILHKRGEIRVQCVKNRQKVEHSAEYSKCGERDFPSTLYLVRIRPAAAFVNVVYINNFT
jgi:hypothetical protein